MAGPNGVFVHPQALCESTEVGVGTRVWAFAHVMAGARVGRDCNVCGHAFVESGATVGDRVTVKNGVVVWDRVTVEDDVFLGPYAVFTNDLRPRGAADRRELRLTPTVVRRGATVGANATIVCGVEVGEYAMVGAGAVVTRDVLPYALVTGNPGRPSGWVCRCGERLADGLRCSCGLSYRWTAVGLAVVGGEMP
jgi:UDP-2-acetamido-3-amino-2,3-dideoxy-glucuronate N-acetyltransferase